MHSLPRSQGLVGGLIGLIVIELAVIAAVVAIVITYGGIQSDLRLRRLWSGVAQSSTTIQNMSRFQWKMER